MAPHGVEHTGHNASPAATIGSTSTPIEHVGNSTTTTPARRVDRASAVSGKPVGAAGSVSDLAIKEATKQGKNVVIDARNQAGLTESKARQATVNAVRELSKSRVSEVHFFGQDANKSFEIVVTK